MHLMNMKIYNFWEELDETQYMLNEIREESLPCEEVFTLS